jgi:uncharacterized protein YoxC
MPEPDHPTGTWTPRPDPTVLTTEAQARGLQAERDYVNGQLQVLRQRLDGMDTATQVLHESVNRVPTEVQREVAHLNDLFDTRFQQIEEKVTGHFLVDNERFQSIEKQFVERDTRVQQSSVAADQALNAALQAAKELVNAQSQASTDAAEKSETSFTKQIDQIGVQLQSVQAALDARITELKERIDRGEGGHTADRRSSVDARTWILGLAVVFVAIAGIIAQRL